MANYREMTLGELLNDAEKAEFLELRKRGYISDELVPKFYNRFVTELENADHTRQYTEARTLGTALSRQFGTDADTIRQNAFKNAVEGLSERNRPLWRSIAADVGTLSRSLSVDEEGEPAPFLETIAAQSAGEYLKEHHVFTPFQLLKETAATMVGGIGDVASGRAGEYGEHALEHYAKIGSVVPVGRIAGKGLAASLSASATRGAAKSIGLSSGALRQAVNNLARNSTNMTFSQAVDELASAGVGRARASEILEKAVSHPAWRVPAHATEAADILGAREEVLIELMGEGTLEATGVGFDVARRRFQSQPTEVIDEQIDTRGIQGVEEETEGLPATTDAIRVGTNEATDEVSAAGIAETQDPIAARAEANEVAAQETQQRARGPRIAATLDAEAIQMASLTQQIATGVDNPTNNDIVNLTDEAFVQAFENEIAPQVAERIQALEDSGVQNAGDALRARMLELHQQHRAELQAPTPEQSAATEIAGQPTQEIIDEQLEQQTTETVETAPPIPEQPTPEPTTESSNVERTTETEPEIEEVAPPEEVATQPDAVEPPPETEGDLVRRADEIIAENESQTSALDTISVEIGGETSNYVNSRIAKGMRNKAVSEHLIASDANDAALAESIYQKVNDTGVLTATASLDASEVTGGISTGGSEGIRRDKDYIFSSIGTPYRNKVSSSAAYGFLFDVEKLLLKGALLRQYGSTGNFENVLTGEEAIRQLYEGGIDDYELLIEGEIDLKSDDVVGVIFRGDTYLKENLSESTNRKIVESNLGLRAMQIEQDGIAPPEEVATQPDEATEWERVASERFADIEQPNPLEMTYEEAVQAREVARARTVDTYNDDLLEALGTPERVARFKELSKDESSPEFQAEFGDLTGEQLFLIYGHSSDPRLTHEEWDTILRAYGDVFSAEDMGIQSLAFAMMRSKPEQIKTAIASQGGDIKQNINQIADAIRIKGIIESLREQGYTQERIASEVSSYLSTQGLEPNDISDMLSPWFITDGQQAQQPNAVEAQETPDAEPTRETAEDTVATEPETPTETTDDVDAEPAETAEIDQQVLNAIGDRTFIPEIVERTGLSREEVESSIQSLLESELIAKAIGGEVYGRAEHTYPLEERLERSAQTFARLTVAKDRLDKVIRTDLGDRGLTEAEIDDSVDTVKQRVDEIRKETKAEERKEKAAEKRKQDRIEKAVSNVKYLSTNEAQAWRRGDDDFGMVTGLKGYSFKHKGFDFYLFKEPDRDGNQTGNWQIVEATTGLAPGNASGKTRQEALRSAITVFENVGIDKFREVIAGTLEKRRAEAEPETTEETADEQSQVESTDDTETVVDDDSGSVSADTTEGTDTEVTETIEPTDEVALAKDSGYLTKTKQKALGRKVAKAAGKASNYHVGQARQIVNAMVEAEPSKYIETGDGYWTPRDEDVIVADAVVLFNRKFGEPEVDTETEAEPTDAQGSADVDIPAALQTVGIQRADWEASDADSKRALLQDAYDAELDAVDFDTDAIPEAFTQAFNTLNATIDEGTLSDVVVDSEQAIERILNDMDASPTKARVRGVRDHIKKGLPLRLIGHQVRSAEEVAVLGQLVRDPQVETTWIVYRKAGRILKVEPYTLNRVDSTPTGSISHVEKMLEELGADDFVRIHNHPSAIARYAIADKKSAKRWREHFGERYAEDVIVDSGTYAFANLAEGTFEEEVLLPSEEVGWDVSVPPQTPIDTIYDFEFKREGIRPNDPLYQNSLVRGARRVAHMGMGLKNKPGWSTVFTVESDGDIRDISEYNQATLKEWLSLARAAQEQDREIHISTGTVTAGQRQILQQLGKAEGIGSIWINGERVSEATTTPDEGILSDVVNDTERGRDITNPKRGILQILGVKTRQSGRMARHAFESGFGTIQEMRSEDEANLQIGDKLYDDVINMGDVFHNEFGQEDFRFDEFMTEFANIASQRVTPTVIDKLNPQQRGLRAEYRTRASNKVWRFIEENQEITDDPELADFANRFKEFWRGLQLKGVKAMLAKVKEVKDLYDEEIYIVDSKGNRVAWYPEEFDGFKWDADREVFVRGDETFTVEQAHENATRLYTPHYFRHHVLRQEYKKVERLLNSMDRVMESDTPEKMQGTLRSLSISKEEADVGDATTTVYRFDITGEEFANVEDALVVVRDYLSQRSTYFREMLQYHDAGIRNERRGQGTDEPRIGHYGQLERARQTGDQNYERNIGLLKETRKLMWHRFAEISTVGQTHPFDGNSPRMEQNIKEVREYDKNDREKALRTVATALRAGQPDSMFERLPEFARGVETGLGIQQDWVVYEEQQEKDAKGETITKRVKTDEPVEIDIARMNLPQNVLDTLEKIGFIDKNADGQYKIAGESVAERHLTMARYFYEFYNTIARRENRVRSLFMSLGHWDSRNPLEMDEEQFFDKVNDMVTIGTIGYGTSLLNLVESLGATQDVATINTIRGIQTMMNKEKRTALLQLSSAMSNTARFLTDTSLGEKYFTSGWSLFSHTDKHSRAFGIAAGLENAKDLIRNYTKTTGKRKDALRRMMLFYNLNPNIVDAAITQGDIDAQIKSAEDTIYAGDVDMSGTPAEQMNLANAMLRAGRFLSNEVFKRYDATSLPPFLMRRSPFLRLFTKFKSWQYQQNRQQYKRAQFVRKEAQQGNFMPAWNMAQGMAILGGTYAMMGFIWSANRDEEHPAMRFIGGMLEAQTFGYASVLLQLALRAEGNWYRLQKDLVSQLGGPAGSITAGIVSPIITGDFGQAGDQLLYRIPVANVLKRTSGFRLPEILEGEDE